MINSGSGRAQCRSQLQCGHVFDGNSVCCTRSWCLQYLMRISTSCYMPMLLQTSAVSQDPHSGWGKTGAVMFGSSAHYRVACGFGDDSKAVQGRHEGRGTGSRTPSDSGRRQAASRWRTSSVALRAAWRVMSITLSTRTWYSTTSPASLLGLQSSRHNLGHLTTVLCILEDPHGKLDSRVNKVLIAHILSSKHPFDVSGGRGKRPALISSCCTLYRLLAGCDV